MKLFNKSKKDHAKVRMNRHPISGGGYNFHALLSLYHVDPWVYLPNQMWSDINAFQNFRLNSDGPTNPYIIAKEFRNGMKLNPQKSEVWQFNALVSNMDSCIRCLAVMGEPSMREISFFEENILWPFYKLKVAFLNLYVHAYNKIVVFRSMDVEEANKYIESGGTVSTLDYGARQYLYRLEAGVVMVKLPWGGEDFKPNQENQLPEYFAPYRKHK